MILSQILSLICRAKLKSWIFFITSSSHKVVLSLTSTDSLKPLSTLHVLSFTSFSKLMHACSPANSSSCFYKLCSKVGSFAPSYSKHPTQLPFLYRKCQFWVRTFSLRRNLSSFTFLLELNYRTSCNSRSYIQRTF